MSELTRLVLCHFGDALARAVRAAYEEPFGGPLPGKFIITLASPDDPPRERQPSLRRRLFRYLP